MLNDCRSDNFTGLMFQIKRLIQSKRLRPELADRPNWSTAVGLGPIPIGSWRFNPAPRTTSNSLK